MTDLPSEPPPWIASLSAALANLCLELDSDEHHIFRSDVLETFPLLRESYAAICPVRMDLSTMRAKATKLIYVTAELPPLTGTSEASLKRRQAAKFVATPHDALVSFMKDVQLMHDNCVAFNGAASAFAVTAADMLHRARSRLSELEAQYTTTDASFPKRVSSIKLSLKPTTVKLEGKYRSEDSVEQQPKPRQPRGSDSRAAAPKPEQFALPLAVPARLRALCIEEVESAKRRTESEGASIASWLEKDRQTSPGIVADGGALEIIKAKLNGRYRQQLCTADDVLQQFLDNVRRLSSSSREGTDEEAHRITADFAATCTIVVERVIAPVFDDTVVHIGLFPEERLEALAYVASGLVELHDLSGRTVNHSPLPAARWRSVFGPRQLLRVLLCIPSMCAAVLQKYFTGHEGLSLDPPTPQPVAAVDVIKRNICPVVDMLLQYLDVVLAADASQR